MLFFSRLDDLCKLVAFGCLHGWQIFRDVLSQNENDEAELISLYADGDFFGWFFSIIVCAITTEKNADLRNNHQRNEAKEFYFKALSINHAHAKVSSSVLTWPRGFTCVFSHFSALGRSKSCMECRELSKAFGCFAQPNAWIVLIQRLLGCTENASVY